MVGMSRVLATGSLALGTKVCLEHRSPSINSMEGNVRN